MHAPKSILGVEGLCEREGSVYIAIITAIKHQNSHLKLSYVLYILMRVVLCLLFLMLLGTSYC